MRVKRLFSMGAASVLAVGSGSVLLTGHGTTTAKPVPQVPAVVATANIPPLATINASNVRVIQVPAGTVSGAIAVIPTGLSARVPMVAGQFVMGADVGQAVPQGDALVGIQTTLSQSSGVVQPGQKVELISVLPGSGNTPTSSTVLGIATVEGLESSAGAPVVPGTAVQSQTANQTSEVPVMATLLVPKKLAPTVAQADAQGKVYLAVVP